MNKFRANAIIIIFSILLFSCTYPREHIVVDNGMEPAIKIGDKVEYEKFNDKLAYGDIVMAKSDMFPLFLSRVVGLPGDRVTIEYDICIINGKKNEHRLIDKKFRFYEFEEALPNGLKLRVFSFAPYNQSPSETITIPDNHYFLMGDYRSSDANSRVLGPISREKIIGKVTKIHR